MRKTRRVRRLLGGLGKARREKTMRGREGEVVIRVSPLMWVMAVYFIAFGRAYEFVCSLTAVILHELAHAKTAKKLGYAMTEIKLMPYGAALCGNAAINSRDEIIIAIAGPLFNLVIGLVFSAMWWLIPESYLVTQAFALSNIYIGVFNMLPVYPLDGGRVVLSLLSRKIKRTKAYNIMRIVSGATGIAALALFAVSSVYAPNISFFTVGIFMIVSAFFPDDRARYYALFALEARKKRLARLMDTRIYSVSGETPLGDLYKALDSDRVNVFFVYDSDMNKIGELDENKLIDAITERGYVATAVEALNLV